MSLMYGVVLLGLILAVTGWLRFAWMEKHGRDLPGIATAKTFGCFLVVAVLAWVNAWIAAELFVRSRGWSIFVGSLFGVLFAPLFWESEGGRRMRESLGQ